jgi:hemolysin activation/secretion protein
MVAIRFSPVKNAFSLKNIKHLILIMLMTALVKSSASRAAETNSPAVIEDLFAAPLDTNMPVKLLPALDVRTYQIEGNTALPPEEFRMLSNYTGKVDSTRVREGLEKLQGYYGELGFSNLDVTLPEQKITNGLVRIKIIENAAGTNAESTLAASITNLFLAPEKRQTFEILHYRIEGNTVLPPEKFSVLTNYIGTVDFARVREGLGLLQLLYRDLGFVTVSVTLPQQKLTNGIVTVKIIEGKLASIKVAGNLHFSTDNVLRALPSLDTNILLNTKWLQPELDRANANQDRQIYPVISPGLEPGTSDLTLKVKDRLPLHEHIEINDKSTPGTPLLRVDTAIQYGNLWQRDHQIGFDYNFSPDGMKPVDHLPQFYDQPTIASYSGYYRLPLGFNDGLREKYENLPVDFGYDEVTHRFNLPPLTGQPELIAYASRSTTDMGTTLGPVSPITESATLNIFSQDAQRVPSVTGNVGGRFILPLAQWAGVQSSVSAGFDVKSYQTWTFYTNYDVAQNIDTNNSPPTVTSYTVTNANNSGNSVLYVPLSFGWSGSRPDPQGSFSFSYNQSLFLEPLASARKNFQAITGSTQAGGNYTTINAGLIREQNLPGQWSAVLNANGQWASEPLINNEQFGLGGTSGVRGYQEGEAYGDTGWRTLFDLRAPPINVGYFPTDSGDVPANLRVSWFMDYGQIYHLDQPAATAIQEWGTGVGFYLTASEHFAARLTLGYALLGTPVTSAGNIQAYFSVGYQF